MRTRLDRRRWKGKVGCPHAAYLPLRLMPSSSAVLVAACQPTAVKPPLPLFSTRVPAGFPVPGDDHQEGSLNLHDHVVRREASTFFVRADGDSMTGAGIYPGDLLVVDRSVEARPGHVVVTALDGEMTVKRLRRSGGRLFLASENDAYPPIEVGEGRDLQVWGVVTHALHEL